MLLEKSSQTGSEASHKRTDVDMVLKQCYLETSSQAAPEALLFQRFRSQKLRWPSLATVVLARLASTSKLAEVADVVVVVLLSCWWW